MGGAAIPSSRDPVPLAWSECGQYVAYVASGLADGVAVVYSVKDVALQATSSARWGCGEAGNGEACT